MLLNVLGSLIGVDRSKGKPVAIRWPLKSEPVRELILVEVESVGNLLDLFRQTYFNELTAEQNELAEKVFAVSPTAVSYGVLVNPETDEAEFAFCKLFAWYNELSRTIERLDIDKVLIDYGRILRTVPRFQEEEADPTTLLDPTIIETIIATATWCNETEVITMADTNSTQVQGIVPSDDQSHPFLDLGSLPSNEDRPAERPAIPEPDLQMGPGWNEFAEEI